MGTFFDEVYIDEFGNLDGFNWYSVCKHKKLSESFIRKYIDNFDWIDLCYYQNLSIEFMKDFSHKLHWDLISVRQQLTEESIDLFKHKLNLESVLNTQKLSKEFENKVIEWMLEKNKRKRKYIRLTDSTYKQYGMYYNTKSILNDTVRRWFVRGARTTW